MKDEGQQLFTFLEFCDSPMHIEAVWTTTLVRWIRSGELTPGQYVAVQAEMLKRKGLNCA